MRDTITSAYTGARTCPRARPSARGKFLFVDEEKLFVHGVTYGTFRPDARGDEFHDHALVDRDFALMAARGVNAVRTYSVPPRWLLDAAWRHGLRVMVGLPWEQHVDFLSDRRHADDIERRVREGVRGCAGHPAVLCYVVGNEIPASIVRWLGKRRVERFIKRLYRAAKHEDPEGLVTYVNYPTTEYLSLPFLDFVAFNVYLESSSRLEAYLARLHNLAGDRPLIMAEIGLDSRRNGEETQADAVEWQVRAAFAAGCAGAFVFAWTDEWHRGGYEIEDWDFGVTRRDRTAKPALAAIERTFADVPFPPDNEWPHVSVIVCSYNGARTIGRTLAELGKLQYPSYDVIVVDDGSTDATAAIAREFPVRLIRTRNEGLSRARNTGLAAAKGEIVAYIDDDAYPDAHWLTYLADTFRRSSHVGVGGPNLPPPDDGPIAACVADAPGGPTHVLLSDREAEHIPGCNMAFRCAALRAIGGFDPQFRVAGDDVDVCWRLQECGWTLGFHPAAVVWHHRRRSVRAYLRQQIGYGSAEGMMERKWPEKYNAVGRPAWGGRIYASYLTAEQRWRRSRIYHGTWGGALFQSAHQRPPGWLQSIVTVPEWYLVIGLLGVLSACGAFWSPLLGFTPLLAIAIVIPIVQAVMIAAGASSPKTPRGLARLEHCLLTAALHLLQPLAHLWGRLRFGLTPWRRTVSKLSWPAERLRSRWSEQWRSAEAWLNALEIELRRGQAATRRGGDFDLWDIEVRGGIFGAARTLMVIEEHGAGKQLVRFRIWPRPSPAGALVSTVFMFLAIGALYDGATSIALALISVAVVLGGITAQECAGAVASLTRAVGRQPEDDIPARAGTALGRVEPESSIQGMLSGGVPARLARNETASSRRQPEAAQRVAARR